MGKTNNEMVEIVELRRSNRKLTARNEELEKWLNRANRELETMSAQYGDKGSKHLIDRIKSVLEGE